MINNEDEEEQIIIKLYNEDLNQQMDYESSHHSSKLLNTYEEFSKKERELKINKNLTTIGLLKIYLSEIKNVSSEKIHLFVKKNKKFNKSKNNKKNIIIIQNISINEIKDNLKDFEEIKDDSDLIGKYIDLMDDKIINNYPYFYYIISSNNIDSPIQNYSISIIIDFYQQNIDKIFLTLQSNCSLFLLKNIINNKLNNSFNINQLKLNCIDITQINIEINTKNVSKNNNNVFSDKKTLDDIVTFFYPIQNNYIIIKYTIHFLLTIKNNIGSSEQIGLNFRFNYLKEVNKISFNENAPEYCECSDGINLFAFCFNQECLLFNKYFVVNLGYGIFNILKQSKKVKCPKCGSHTSIEIKNIGIINSKYFYSGKLKTKEKEKSPFEGDGITLDEKLYIFKEAKINSFLIQLYIEAKPHFVTMKKFFTSKRTKEDEELDDIALCDDINLNTNNDNNYFKSNKNIIPPMFKSSTIGIDNNNSYLRGFSLNESKTFLKNLNMNQYNTSKIKIYDNESEILEKNNIIVDKYDDKNENGLNSINCIGDADIFSGGCFTTKKSNDSENIQYFQKSSFCFIF